MRRADLKCDARYLVRLHGREVTVQALETGVGPRGVRCSLLPPNAGPLFGAVDVLVPLCDFIAPVPA